MPDGLNGPVASSFYARLATVLSSRARPEECEAWALHPGIAIADKRPELTPIPPQVIITEREVPVYWLDKAGVSYRPIICHIACIFC